MLTKIVLEPVTDKSYPFASSTYIGTSVRNKPNLDANGYVEDEYFMYGTANIYEEDGTDSFSEIMSNLPYCNRFIIRRPQDTKKFSGNVVVEIINPTARIDLDRMWAISGKHFIESGDIYIGITSKPDTFDSLWAFDKERYSKLNWNYPLERKVIPKKTDNILPDPKPDMEIGLFWDMLTDLALLLKNTNPMNPLSSYGDYKVVLTGWSQSAAYLWTYLKRLALNEKYNQGVQLFDGYFAAGGVHHAIIPLNQDGYAKERNALESMISYMPVPYIVVQTESENANFSAYECRQENSDDKDFHYRIYEITGSTHDNKQTLLDYYDTDESVSKIGMTPRYIGKNPLPTDFPYQFAFNAFFSHLFAWINKGIAPPCCDRIELIPGTTNNKIDENGNAIGGVRSPFIDVPTCTYHSYSDADFGKFPLFGHMTPFSSHKFIEIYGTLSNYMKLVAKSTEKLIHDGFLLQDDYDEIIDFCRNSAEECLNENNNN